VRHLVFLLALSACSPALQGVGVPEPVADTADLSIDALCRAADPQWDDTWVAVWRAACGIQLATLVSEDTEDTEAACVATASEVFVVEERRALLWERACLRVRRRGPAARHQD